MKIKAGDLKHGQRFKMWGHECVAGGMVTKFGKCVYLAGGELGLADKDNDVELLDPTPEPVVEQPAIDIEAIAVGMGLVDAPAIEPGEVTYMELAPHDRVRMGDEWQSTTSGMWHVIAGPETGYIAGDVLKGYPNMRAIRRRIAPTNRPYTDAEMLDLLGKRVRRKNKTTKHGWLINDVDDGSTMVGNSPVSARQLLRDYEFLDGEACGVSDEQA